jgi:cytochrome b561
MRQSFGTATNIRSPSVTHLVEVAPRARLPFDTLLIQPATGLAQTILRGRPFEVFGWTIPQLVARDVALVGIFHAAHEIGAWCLFALAGAHAAAALVHHFVLRDDVLEAMAPALRRRGSS